MINRWVGLNRLLFYQSDLKSHQEQFEMTRRIIILAVLADQLQNGTRLQNVLTDLRNFLRGTAAMSDSGVLPRCRYI